MATITIEQAKEISVLKRPEGRSTLQKHIGWEAYDEDDDLQRAILLDYLYDSLMFTIEKGMPWPHVCQLFTLSQQMQEEGIGQSLTQTIKLFSTKCHELTGKVNERCIKKYTEYFFGSYLTHHKLYQYVFSMKQEELRKQVDVTIETPETPLPFPEAQEVAVYDYEKKMNEIEENEAQKKDDRIKEKREVAQQTEERIHKSYDQVQEVEQSMSQEKLVEIIHEVASAHITAASHSIKINIEETIEDLEFMLQKTALPRPQVMARGPYIPASHTPRTEEKLAPSSLVVKDDTTENLPPLQAFGKQSPPNRHKTKTPIPAKRPISKAPDSREKQSTVPPSRN